MTGSVCFTLRLVGLFVLVAMASCPLLAMRVARWLENGPAGG